MSRGRAFILGNSGELLDHNLNLLKGETVFGVNALPLRCAEIITHYVCMDIGMAFVPEVRELVPKTAKKYYSRILWNTIWKEDNVTVFDCYPDKIPGFEISDSKVHGGSTVTYAALQIAAALGYNPIYLLGIDLGLPSNGISHIPEQDTLMDLIHSKNLSDVTVDKREISAPNTSPSANGSKKMQFNFLLARDVLKEHGIEVFNLSKGGNLNCFRRMKFEDVLNETKEIAHV